MIVNKILCPNQVQLVLLLVTWDLVIDPKPFADHYKKICLLIPWIIKDVQTVVLTACLADKNKTSSCTKVSKRTVFVTKS